MTACEICRVDVGIYPAPLLEKTMKMPNVQSMHRERNGNKVTFGKSGAGWSKIIIAFTH